MEENKIIMERLTRLDEKVQGVVNQLDLDRRDIDQIRIGLQAVQKGNEAVLQQLTDFKSETRQNIEDVISQKLPIIVKKEIRLLSVKHPRKQIKGRLGLLERIKNYFKHE